MVVHVCKNKRNAKRYASRMRRRGFKTTVFKRKSGGYGVSVTRK